MVRDHRNVIRYGQPSLIEFVKNAKPRKADRSIQDVRDLAAAVPSPAMRYNEVEPRGNAVPDPRADVSPVLMNDRSEHDIDGRLADRIIIDLVIGFVIGVVFGFLIGYMYAHMPDATEPKADPKPINRSVTRDLLVDG